MATGSQARVRAPRQGRLAAGPEHGRLVQTVRQGNPVRFDEAIQRTALDELHVASQFQKFAIFAYGSDPSHLHVLVGWPDARSWETVRRSIRTSLTRRMNREFGKRTWFLENSSRKRVRDRGHFDYLIDRSLPDHPGIFWRYRAHQRSSARR